MGFKGRALASVKVTSEESPLPRQGTVGSGGGEVLKVVVSGVGW